MKFIFRVPGVSGEIEFYATNPGDDVLVFVSHVSRADDDDTPAICLDLRVLEKAVQKIRDEFSPERRG